MAIKVNGTTVIDDSSNVCANSVCTCCVDASSTVTIPSGNTAGRPTGSVGELYFDTDEGKLVAHDGTDWAVAGGSGAVPDCNCFYIPTCRSMGTYAQYSCYNCDFEGDSYIGASLSPNGSTAISANVCVGTCKYGGYYNVFLCRSFRMRLDNPAEGVTDIERGGGGGCAMCSYPNALSIPYCGLNDTDPRATPMYATACNSNRSLAVFWCGTCNVFRGRCTCANTGAYSCYHTGATPQEVLFTPSGPWGDLYARSCFCCGLSVVSDYCCGLWAGLVGKMQGECSCSTHLYILYGFKPCYLYDATSCCADAANSPIQYEVFKSSCLNVKGARLAFDWPNKRLYILSSESQYPTQCTGLSSWCICDKGFPDCQACWCLHCVSNTYYRYGNMTGIGGMSQLCGFGDGNRSSVIINSCMLTLGCRDDYMVLFKPTGYCVFCWRTYSNGYPYCEFCMSFQKIFLDNECSIRILAQGPNTTGSYQCAQSQYSGTYDITYARPSYDFLTNRPCRLALYRMSNQHCCCVYIWQTFKNSTEDHKNFEYEPITNRVSIPIGFTNCNTCGGRTQGILVTNLIPKSVATNVNVSYGGASTGSPALIRFLCDSNCVRLYNETACPQCCATYWKVWYNCGTSCTTYCSNVSISRVEKNGVALCPGCRTFCDRGQLYQCVDDNAYDFIFRGAISGHKACCIVC